MSYRFFYNIALTLTIISVCCLSMHPQLSLSSSLPERESYKNQSLSSEEDHLFLQGFKPGTEITYTVLSRRGDILFEAVEKTDKHGSLLLNYPRVIKAENTQIIYNLRIFNPKDGTKDFLFRHDLKFGKISLVGQGLQEFSKVQVITQNQALETKTDWSGNFTESEILADTGPDTSDAVSFKIVLDAGDLADLQDAIGNIENLDNVTQVMNDLEKIKEVTEVLGDLEDVIDLTETLHEAKNQLAHLIDEETYSQYMHVLDDLNNLEQITEALESLEKFNEIADALESLEVLEDLEDVKSIVENITDVEELAEALEGVANLEEITRALDALGELDEITDALEALDDFGGLVGALDDLSDLADFSAFADLAELGDIADALGAIGSLGDLKDLIGDIDGIMDIGGFSVISIFSGLGGGGPFSFGIGSFIGGSTRLSTGNTSAMNQHVEDMKNNYVTALMLMTEQLSAVVMSHTMMVGQFFDAKQQLETQLLHQSLSAEAHKDYHPSEEMCRFGSYVRSLANVEQKAMAEKLAINEMLMQRYNGNQGSSATFGRKFDADARLQEFREVYCDLSDNAGGMGFMCDHDQNFSGGAKGGSDAERFNKDIDYMATIEMPATLDINFKDQPTSPPEPRPDEQDVLALAKNLYWPTVFETGDEELLNRRSDEYLSAQRIKALSSIAHTSYAHLVGLKASAAEPAGSLEPGWTFMKTFMREFGISDSKIEEMIGEQPSYWAQMEVLTKKIYQSPHFYTNLYDKPVNIDRIDATLSAIQLMQMRDHYTSQTRSEMLASARLELALESEYNRIQTDLLKSANR